jgi:hypothetical protein
VEYNKPTTWAARMNNYYYATVKGMSVWRTMFGVGSGLFQTGTTYWLASFVHQPVQAQAALVSFVFGTGIGANLGTYQNWIERGALEPVSYKNEDWRTETNLFTRLGKQLSSIAWGPTLTSRYARGMAVSLAFANTLLLATHSGDIHLTTLAGIGASLALYFKEIIWKIPANTWASNKGKTGIEENVRLLRRKRIFTDNARLTAFGKNVETDIPRIQVYHQAVYNPTNNMFKLMDYITPWGWFVFTTGNFLNILLERVGLRTAARAAWLVDRENSERYYKLYESSVLEVMKNWLLRTVMGKTRMDHMMDWLTPDERASMGILLKDIENTENGMSEIERDIWGDTLKTAQKTVEDKVFTIYHRRKEERMDRITEALKTRVNAAADTARAAAVTVIRPFAPADVKARLPRAGLSAIARSCRAVFAK